MRVRRKTMDRLSTRMVIIVYERTVGPIRILSNKQSKMIVSFVENGNDNDNDNDGIIRNCKQTIFIKTEKI